MYEDLIREREREREGPFFSATYYRYLSRDREVSTTRVGSVHTLHRALESPRTVFTLPPIRSDLSNRSIPDRPSLAPYLLDDNDFETLIKKKKRRIARRACQRSSSPKVKRPCTDVVQREKRQEKRKRRKRRKKDKKGKGLS